MNQILAAIMAVLPEVIVAIQDIVKAIDGGQPVTAAHTMALRSALDNMHDGVVAAAAPANNP